jgi:hypothetical protein
MKNKINTSKKINKIRGVKTNKTHGLKKNNQKRQTNDNMIFLNGPINYFKLSNNNNQINIFMDYHAPIYRQRKCDDYESKDIDKYFNKILSKIPTTSNVDTMDFFLEINPTNVISKNKYYSNDNYLLSIRKMFSKLYKEKYSDLDEDDMPQQNIRLHYMDIRDYSSFNELNHKLEAILLELDKNKLDNLNYINAELGIIKNILMFIDSMINSIITTKNPLYETFSAKKIDFINLKEKMTTESKKISTIVPNNSDTNNSDTNNSTTANSKNTDTISQPIPDVNTVLDAGLYQILQKILFNYVNSNNRDNIINLFTEHYIKTSQYIVTKLSKLMERATEIDKIIDDYVVSEKITFEEINFDKKDGSRDISPYYYYSMVKYKDFLREVTDEIEEINHLIIKMGVIMTDCYFLRRLTDNSNIKKSIIYTGAYHSVIYLWFLIKYNDYIIKDYYHLNGNMTTKNLVEIIKKSDYLDIIKYVIPDKINQCIKIKEL